MYQVLNELTQYKAEERSEENVFINGIYMNTQFRLFTLLTLECTGIKVGQHVFVYLLVSE